jgi:hypothetical protein
MRTVIAMFSNGWQFDALSMLLSMALNKKVIQQMIQRALNGSIGFDTHDRSMV